MEAIVNFLLEYYVWVLVVLVILLITVIGFLADSMKKKKMRKKVEAEEASQNTNAPSQSANVFTNMDNLNNNMMNPNMMNPNMNSNMNMNANNFNNNFNMSGNLNNNMMSNQNYMNSSMNMNSGLGNVQASPEGVGVYPNQMPSSTPNTFTASSVNPSNLNGPDLTNMDNNFNSSISNGPVPTAPTIEANQNNDASFFTPVSDQTPKIEPREVVIPKPVEITPIMNNEAVNNFNSYNQPSANTSIPSEPVVVPNPGMPVEVQSVGQPLTSDVTAPNNMVNKIPEVPAMGPIPNSGYTEPVVAPIPNPSYSAPVNQEIVNNAPNNFVNPTIEPSINSINQNLASNPNMNGFVNPSIAPNNGVNVPNNSNSNFIAGGSTFVVGTPQQTINPQNNPNNGNW